VGLGRLPRRRLHGFRGQRARPASPLRAVSRREHALMEITRVDYIRVPVDDIEAAKQFYGETLGLPRNEHLDHDDWIEYEGADVTLAVKTAATHECDAAA